MNNSNELLIEKVLEKLTEVAEKKPEILMLYMAECMSFLAMNRVSDEEMAQFERKAFYIIDTYTTPAMREDGVMRSGGQIQ